MSRLAGTRIIGGHDKTYQSDSRDLTSGYHVTNVGKHDPRKLRKVDLYQSAVVLVRIRSAPGPRRSNCS
jgi:hypothetical protein